MYGFTALAPFTSQAHTTGNTAPAVPPIAPPIATSFIVASLHFSSSGVLAPNQAPTIADLPARLPSHFAPAKYPPPIGDTHSATSGR